MVDFKKYLQESKDRKFQVLASKRESEPNPYSCNYCPKNHHKFCEHAHCIFDEEWSRNDPELTKLRNKLKEETEYLNRPEPDELYRIFPAEQKQDQKGKQDYA